MIECVYAFIGIDESIKRKRVEFTGFVSESLELGNKVL